MLNNRRNGFCANRCRKSNPGISLCSILIKLILNDFPSHLTPRNTRIFEGCRMIHGKAEALVKRQHDLNLQTSRTRGKMGLCPLQGVVNGLASAMGEEESTR